MKKWLAVLAGLLMSMNLAFAVDVNTASQQELESVKGIGPKLSSRIVEERKKAGRFKDMADLESRVKGVGENNSKKFADGGLTVGGGRASSARSAASLSSSTGSAADKGKAMASDKASAATDKAKASAGSMADKAKAAK